MSVTFNATVPSTLEIDGYTVKVNLLATGVRNSVWLTNGSAGRVLELAGIPAGAPGQISGSFDAYNFAMAMTDLADETHNPDVHRCARDLARLGVEAYYNGAEVSWS